MNKFEQQRLPDTEATETRKSNNPNATLQELRALKKDVSELEQLKESIAVDMKGLKDNHEEVSRKITEVHDEVEAKQIELYEQWKHTLPGMYVLFSGTALMSRKEGDKKWHRLFDSKDTAIDTTTGYCVELIESGSRFELEAPYHRAKILREPGIKIAVGDTEYVLTIYDLNDLVELQSGDRPSEADKKRFLKDPELLIGYGIGFTHNVTVSSEHVGTSLYQWEDHRIPPEHNVIPAGTTLYIGSVDKPTDNPKDITITFDSFANDRSKQEEGVRPQNVDACMSIKVLEENLDTWELIDPIEFITT